MKIKFLLLLFIFNFEFKQENYLLDCSLDINIFNSTLNKRFFRVPDCKHYNQSKLASFWLLK